MFIGRAPYTVPPSQLSRTDGTISFKQNPPKSPNALFQDNGDHLKSAARERLEYARERLKALLLLSIISPEAVLRHAKFLARELAQISELYGQGVELSLLPDIEGGADLIISQGLDIQSELGQYKDKIALLNADRDFALYVDAIKSSIEGAVARAKAQIDNKKNQERLASDEQAIKSAEEALQKADQALRALHDKSIENLFRSTDFVV